MAYPPAVEQWRPIVEQYFRPEDVDKALFVIQHESGGNPGAVGDGGHAIGLFQHNSFGLASGRSLQALADPAANIRLAAEAVYGGQGWKPWGENNLYNGQPFGALGRNAYPGTITDVAQSFQQNGTRTNAPQGGTQVNQNPGDLPEGARILGGNLAVWTDPNGTTFYFQYNPTDRVDLNTGEFIPKGWNPRGTPKEAENPAAKAEPAKNIRVNSTTGKAYVVDNQGNIVRPAPEFDEKPAGANTKPALSPTAQAILGRQQVNASLTGQAIPEGVNAVGGNSAIVSGGTAEPKQPTSVRGPNSGFGQEGEIAGQWLPTPDGQSYESGARGALDQTLQASYLKRGANREEDFTSANQALAGRQQALAPTSAGGWGLSPTDYQSMLDLKALGGTGAVAAANNNARMNYWDDNQMLGDYRMSSVTSTGSGKTLPISSEDYAALTPTQRDAMEMMYAANGTPDFNTPNPIAFVDMVTGQPIGMAGGTGRETISVDPDGPHGTPAQEAQVGSRMWPGLMGVKPYANGTDDILQQVLSGSQDGPLMESTSTPDYSSMNGGRDPDYISASMLGLNTSSGEPGGVSAPDGVYQRQVASWNNEFRPTLSPEEIYLQRKAQGWSGNSTFMEPEPELNDEGLRYALLHLNDPIMKLPARMWPKQFLLDPALQRARRIARDPEYYGYTDQFMADGGSGFAGHPGNADGGGFSNLARVFQLQDLDNAGVFDRASAMWNFYTPEMQNSLWATQSLPGNGNPLGGNSFLPAVSYPGLYMPWYGGYSGKPLASYYNTDLAPTTLDINRELGSQYNANASRSLGLEAPLTPQQIMNTPVNKLKTQGANANPNPAAMADGGMGMAGSFTPGLEDVILGREQGTNPALMRTLAQVLTSKTGYKQPYTVAA